MRAFKLRHKKNFIRKVLHLAMIMYGTILRVHLAFLMIFDKLRLYVFRVLDFSENSCLITFHDKSFLHINYLF